MKTYTSEIISKIREAWWILRGLVIAARIAHSIQSNDTAPAGRAEGLLSPMDMTHPDIVKAERDGGKPEALDDEEDWLARDNYALARKKSFCGACTKRTSDLQVIDFKYAMLNYSLKIDCKTCKKHESGN